jgi:hypothetical protein
MSRFSQKRYRNVGELSSKYAYDRDGKQFEVDIQAHFDKLSADYAALIEWAQERRITPDDLKSLLRKLILELDL